MLDWSVEHVALHNLSDDDFVPIGADLVAIKVIDIRSQAFGDFETIVNVRFNHDKAMFEAQEVTVLKYADGPEITSAMLRKVRIQDLIGAATPSCVYLSDSTGALINREGIWTGPLRLVTSYDVEEYHRTGPTDEALDWVAKVYTLAKALRLPPAKAVAEEMKLPERTASNWIAKARERKLLVV